MEQIEGNPMQAAEHEYRLLTSGLRRTISNLEEATATIEEGLVDGQMGPEQAAGYFNHLRRQLLPALEAAEIIKDSTQRLSDFFVPESRALTPVTETEIIEAAARKAFTEEGDCDGDCENCAAPSIKVVEVGSTEDLLKFLSRLPKDGGQ